MAVLDFSRVYGDGEILLAADFDVFLNQVEAIVNVTKLNDDNIQATSITASSKFITGTITSSLFASGAITSALIPASAITTSVIADGCLTAAKLTAATLTTAKFATGAVTAAKIANSAVTTAKIVDNSIEAKKFATSSAVSNTVSGSVSSNFASTLTIATYSPSGTRPVIMMTERGTFNSVWQSAQSGAPPTFIILQTGLFGNASFNWSSIYRAAEEGSASTSNTLYIPAGAFSYIYPTIGSGSSQFSLGMRGESGTVTSTATSVRVFVYEF